MAGMIKWYAIRGEQLSKFASSETLLKTTHPKTHLTKLNQTFK